MILYRHRAKIIVMILIAFLIQFDECPSCDSPNVKTVLLSEYDLDCENCWTRERIALVFMRYRIQTLLPIKLPDNIEALSEFIYICFAEVNTFLDDKRIHTLMMMALADTIGGYQHAYGLPLTYEFYYEGNAPLKSVLKIVSEQQEMKRILATNGASWLRPIKISEPISQMKPLELVCYENVEYCNQILFKNRRLESDACWKCRDVPLPVLDDNDKPRAVAVPLKRKVVHSLFNCSSENILQNYYQTANCCLREISHRADGGCAYEIEYFNHRFFLWLKRSIFGHLHDETPYPAFGGILRILIAICHQEEDYTSMKEKPKVNMLSAIKNLITSERTKKIIKTAVIVAAAIAAAVLMYPFVKDLVKKILKWKGCRRCGSNYEDSDEERKKGDSMLIRSSDSFEEIHRRLSRSSTNYSSSVSSSTQQPRDVDSIKHLEDPKNETPEKQESWASRMSSKGVKKDELNESLPSLALENEGKRKRSKGIFDCLCRKFNVKKREKDSTTESRRLSGRRSSAMTLRPEVHHERIDVEEEESRPSRRVSIVAGLDGNEDNEIGKVSRRSSGEVEDSNLMAIHEVSSNESPSSVDLENGKRRRRRREKSKGSMGICDCFRREKRGSADENQSGASTDEQMEAIEKKARESSDEQEHIMEPEGPSQEKMGPNNRLEIDQNRPNSLPSSTSPSLSTIRHDSRSSIIEKEKDRRDELNKSYFY